MRERVCLAMLVCAALLAPRARADEIQFQNGDKLTGKIVKLDGGKLTVDSTVAGKIDVKWAEIATLSSDEPVTIVLDGGTVVADKLVAAEPGSVRTAGTETAPPQTIALASAAKVNPEPVQFHGKLLAGARFDRGNTVSDTFDSSLDAVRRSEIDRITLGAGYSV